MSDELIKRLQEEIIADAFGDGRIQSGKLADRLIRERAEAATALAEAQAEIARLREYYDAVEAFNDTPWKRDVGEMADRVNKARAALTDKPATGGSPTYTGPVTFPREPLTVDVGRYPDGRVVAGPGGGNGGPGYFPFTEKPDAGEGE